MKCQKNVIVERNQPPILPVFSQPTVEEAAERIKSERIKQDRIELKRITAKAERERIDRERLKMEAEAERLARERIKQERQDATRLQFDEFFGSVAGERMVLKIQGVDYAFRWCPPGTFMMGSPKGEEGHGSNEIQHQVTLSKGFWMLETQVTQEMWENVMGSNPSQFMGNRRPVEGVSWDDCQEFIRKLNNSFSPSTLGAGLIGFKFSLPTEAQWEYACRARTTTPFHFGSTLNGDMANCDGRSPYGTKKKKGKYLDKTVVVGLYPTNAWGLYDMHGNVCEWCSDWFDKNYSRGSVVDPVGPSSGSDRVYRGGSWIVPARDCRSAYRNAIKPSCQYDDLGLRLCLATNSPAPSPPPPVPKPHPTPPKPAPPPPSPTPPPKKKKQTHNPAPPPRPTPGTKKKHVQSPKPAPPPPRPTPPTKDNGLGCLGCFFVCLIVGLWIMASAGLFFGN